MHYISRLLWNYGHTETQIATPPKKIDHVYNAVKGVFENVPCTTISPMIFRQPIAAFIPERMLLTREFDKNDKISHYCNGLLSERQKKIAEMQHKLSPLEEIQHLIDDTKKSIARIIYLSNKKPLALESYP